MTFKLGPRAAAAGYRLTAFDQTGSTNVEAMLSARAGERGPMWFVTTEQTAGRGRRLRPWVAPRGNLASSILEVIEVAPASAATLCFAAGLALEQALRKLSIEAALGIDVSAEELFAALSDGWAEFRDIWDHGRGFGEIRQLWLERAAGLGQAVSIKSGSTLIEGTFDTIDEQGCMIVRTYDGNLVPITAGDVYFGSVASAGSA